MFLEKCTDEQLQAIYEEHNITKDSLKRDVNSLMEWMEKQPHLPNVKDEMLISHWLIQCKNRMEKTKKKIDAYYSIKALLPDIFSNRDPTGDGYKIAFNVGCLVPLPKLTPEGDRIYIYRFFNLDISHSLKPDDYQRLNLLTHDISMKDDCYRKMILIYDMENITMNLVNTMFNGSRKYFGVLQDLYMFRIHVVHLILRLNPAISSLLNIVTSLLTKKMSDKIVVWSNARPDLTTMFPAEILPEEYGGKEKPLNQLHEMYYEYICGFREWLKSEEDVKVDLSKRMDNLYKSRMDESLDGSFRQLAID